MKAEVVSHQPAGTHAVGDDAALVNREAVPRFGDRLGDPLPVAGGPPGLALSLGAIMTMFLLAQKRSQ